MVAAPPQILLHIIDRHDDNFKCTSNNVFKIFFDCFSSIILVMFT